MNILFSQCYLIYLAKFMRSTQLMSLKGFNINKILLHNNLKYNFPQILAQNRQKTFMITCKMINIMLRK